VLRVILSLLSMSTDQEHLGGNAWDWWNMVRTDTCLVGFFADSLV
jgi:hypothetical protein